jgi:hypothetical protein
MENLITFQKCLETFDKLENDKLLKEFVEGNQELAAIIELRNYHSKYAVQSL